MQIPKGTVGSVYGYHRGWVGEKNVVSVGFNWTMGDHVTPPKPLEHGHVIQVFGLPNMRTVLHCLPPKDWTEPGFMGLGMIYTAMPVTNAVPAVVAASAGHRDAERSAAGDRPRRCLVCRLWGSDEARTGGLAVQHHAHADRAGTDVDRQAPVPCR